MKNNLNISSDNMIIREIINNFYRYNSFTLTAKAVNDAPVLLQPIEDNYILDDSRAAAMVLKSMQLK